MYGNLEENTNTSVDVYKGSNNSNLEKSDVLISLYLEALEEYSRVIISENIFEMIKNSADNAITKVSKISNSIKDGYKDFMISTTGLADRLEDEVIKYNKPLSDIEVTYPKNMFHTIEKLRNVKYRERPFKRYTMTFKYLSKFDNEELEKLLSDLRLNSAIDEVLGEKWNESWVDDQVKMIIGKGITVVPTIDFVKKLYSVMSKDIVSIEVDKLNRDIISIYKNRSLEYKKYNIDERDSKVSLIYEILYKHSRLIETVLSMKLDVYNRVIKEYMSSMRKCAMVILEERIYTEDFDESQEMYDIGILYSLLSEILIPDELLNEETVSHIIADTLKNKILDYISNFKADMLNSTMDLKRKFDEAKDANNNFIKTFKDQYDPSDNDTIKSHSGYNYTISSTKINIAEISYKMSNVIDKYTKDGMKIVSSASGDLAEEELDILKSEISDMYSSYNDIESDMMSATLGKNSSNSISPSEYQSLLFSYFRNNKHEPSLIVVNPDKLISKLESYDSESSVFRNDKKDITSSCSIEENNIKRIRQTTTNNIVNKWIESYIRLTRCKINIIKIFYSLLCIARKEELAQTKKVMIAVVQSQK